MSSLGSAFWRLFFSSTTSNVADGIARTALPLLAATLTRDPVLVAGLSALTFLPWLLFAIPSGALVDRIDRRRAMVAANFFRAATIGGLGVAAALGAVGIPLLYAAAFALGLAETVYDSAARAMLPHVVARDQLDSGNGLLTTGETVAERFLGAPVGSFLFAWLVAAPMLGTAAAYALAAAVMLSLSGRFRPERAEKTSMRTDIGVGLRWLWNHRLLRGLTLATAVSSFLQSMPSAMVVLYALEVLHVSEAAFGLFMVATGIGGVLGGLLAPLVARRFGRTGGMVAATLTFPLVVAGMGLTTNPYVGGALYGLSAMLIAVWNVLLMSMRQALVPHELFGRVQGAIRTAIWGGIPLGALAAGVLATVTSIPTVFVVSGLANIAVGACVWRILHVHRGEITAAFGLPAHETGPDSPVESPVG